MSKGTVKLGQLSCRQGGHKVSELTLEHQRKKIAANGGGPWQTIFGPQHDLRCQSEDFSINRGAYYSRNIFVLGDKGTGYNDIKSWFPSTLGNPLARSIDFPTPHERACSEMRARAWRASRLRCFRNTAPSFASISRPRSRSANSRSAVRTSAERLRSRREVLVNSSRSFKVASSIVTAIVFILESVSIV